MCAVEWKALSEVFEMRGGYTPSTKNKDFWEDGILPWFRMEDIREKGNILSDSTLHITPTAVKKNGLFPQNSIILATSATIGVHALLTVPALSNQRFTAFYPNEKYVDRVNCKFAYYVFYLIDEWCKNNIVQGGFASVDMNGLKKYLFPIPSLTKQQEIVSQLDTFTTLISNLESELDMRRKQYEHYRNQLLDFEGVEGVEWKTLGEIGDVTKLAGFEFTEHVTYKDKGNIIALRGLNVRNGYLDLSDVKYIDGSNFEKLERSRLCINDMLFTYVGTIGNVALIEENAKFYLAPNVSRIRFNESIIKPRFALHYFQCFSFVNSQINKYLNTSSMKNLTMENIRKFLLPILSRQSQQQIVEKLDAFEQLIQSLETEIKLRKQQYEYYREKLLTFE